jgi:hypothetical protein
MQQTGRRRHLGRGAGADHYANQDTGYTVARVATNRSSELLTVVGPLLGAQPGESLRLRGRWTSHPQYGRQFQVDPYQTMLPAMARWVTEARPSDVPPGLGGGQRVTSSLRTYGVARPAERLVSMALGRRSLIGMGCAYGNCTVNDSRCGPA